MALNFDILDTDMRNPQTRCY